MKTRLQIVLFATLLFTIHSGKKIRGQDTVRNSDLFTRGLFIENLHLLVPWEMNLMKVEEYGNPKIIRKPKTMVQVRWDSIKILNGIDANLFFFTRKQNFGKNSVVKLRLFNCLIDETDILTLKKYFERYTGIEGKLTRNKNDYHYYWTINSCNVRLGNKQGYGGYLLVQKK